MSRTGDSGGTGRPVGPQQRRGASILAHGVFVDRQHVADPTAPGTGLRAEPYLSSL